MYAAFDEVAISGFNENLDLILQKYDDIIDSVASNQSNDFDNDCADDLDIQSEQFEYDAFTDQDLVDDSDEDSQNTSEFQKSISNQELEFLLVTTNVDFKCHRLGCCAHTLQLVIKDGLAKSISIASIISKVAKVCNKIHKSNSHVEVLEEVKKTISSANLTRWNSQLRMIKSILTIPQTAMEKIYFKENELKLSLGERQILEKLVVLLDPFNDLTIDLQKDFGSISVLYPAYRGIIFKLSKFTDDPDLKHIAEEFERSIKARFSFVQTDPIFALASILNPRYGLNWLDDYESTFLRKC